MKDFVTIQKITNNKQHYGHIDLTRTSSKNQIHIHCIYSNDIFSGCTNDKNELLQKASSQTRVNTVN